MQYTGRFRAIGKLNCFVFIASSAGIVVVVWLYFETSFERLRLVAVLTTALVVMNKFIEISENKVFHHPML